MDKETIKIINNNLTKLSKLSLDEILLLEEPKWYEFIDKFYEQIKGSQSQPTPSDILRKEMPMS